MMTQVRLSAVVAGLVLTGFTVMAMERIKADNSTNLNVTVSWTNGVPGVFDYGKWTSVVTGPNYVQLGGDMSVQGLVVANPGGDVGLGGTNSLTVGIIGFNLSAASVNLTVTNQRVALLDYATPLWVVPVGRVLTVSPVQFIRGVGAALGIISAGTVNSAALANDTTGIVGPWAWYGAGTNTKYTAVSGGTVYGYPGTAAAAAGDVTDSTGALNYDVAAAGTLGTGASFNTLRYTGASGTIAGDFSANGLLNAGLGGLTFSGTAMIGAGKELIFVTPDSIRQLSLSGTLADSSGGASGVTVTGGGKVSLTGNNTYSGVTVVNAGTLYINKANALGSTAGNTVVNVNGSSVTGGMLQVAGSITLTEPIMFVGAGDGSPWNSSLSVLNGTTGGTNTLAGPITIATPNGVRITAGGAGTGLNLNGPIIRTAGAGTLVIGAGGAGGVLNVNYPINNNGGGVNTHNGSGLIRLNAAGCNFGTLNVQTAHLVQLGVSDALVTACNLNVGGAANTSGDQARGTFDLNGFNQTVNAFGGNGVPAEPPSVRVVTNSAATLSTLTIGNGNGSGINNGVIVGNIALVKNGSGTEIMCGPNRYTGGTTVNAGILVVSNAVGHGALTVNGGTFRFPDALTVNGTFSGAGGTLDMGLAGSVLTVNQTGDTFFNGAMSGEGAFVKNSAGALTIAGTNTYSGGTTVNEGLLLFGKTNSIPVAGSVSVAPGASLGFGVGGAGSFSTADLDALWNNVYPGLTYPAASPIGIDTSAGSFTYATSQSAGRGLVKTGDNTLTLSGVNTYGGGTIIRKGVLSIPATSALPGWNTNGSFSVWRDAALAVWNAIGDADVATILITTNFMDGGCIGFDTVSGSRIYSPVISNTVSGALGLYKIATNTLTLTGANTYDGTTWVAGGRLLVKHNSALGSTNGVTRILRVGGTASAPGGAYSDSTGQVRFDASGGALVIEENFVINGSEQFGYEGPLRNEIGNTTLNGRVRVGAIGGRISVGSGNLVVNGRIEREDSSSNPGLTLNVSGGVLTLSNRIDIAGGTLNMHSSGVNYLCSTGHVYALAQVQYGNTLRLGIDDALRPDRALTIGQGTNGNGRVDLNGYRQTLARLQEQGTVLNNLITNSQPLVSTLTINQLSGVSDSFGGLIRGLIHLVKTGATNSVLTLRATNNIMGSATVCGGTLALDATGLLGGSCTNVTVEAGTLSVQNSLALANGATLRIVTGGTAKVNLSDGVIQPVRYLFLDDKMQRTGTYGSEISSAVHKSNTYFTGTGVLKVTSDSSGTTIHLK